MSVAWGALMVALVVAIGACGAQSDTYEASQPEGSRSEPSSPSAQGAGPTELRQDAVLSRAWLALMDDGASCQTQILANGSRLTVELSLGKDGGVDAEVEGLAGRGPGGSSSLRLLRPALDAESTFMEIDGQWYEFERDDPGADLESLVNPYELLLATVAEDLDATAISDVGGVTRYEQADAMLPSWLGDGGNTPIALTVDGDGRLLNWTVEFSSNDQAAVLNMTCTDHGNGETLDGPERAQPADDLFLTA